MYGRKHFSRSQYRKRNSEKEIEKKKMKFTLDKFLRPGIINT